MFKTYPFFSNDNSELIISLPKKVVNNKLSENFENYSKYIQDSRHLLELFKFEGVKYRTATFWKNILKVSDYEKKPIRYLEIGVFQGANLISFLLEGYANHKDSEVYGIDPWCNYDEYDEYTDKQDVNEVNFLKNLKKLPKDMHDKIKIYKDFSFNKIKEFDNDFFDIIYIDGNHNSDAVLEDAVMSFRKLKNNGILIFDDVGWNHTNIGIEAFASAFSKKIKMIACKNCQVFYQKLTN
jgi:hypothetical protein